MPVSPLFAFLPVALVPAALAVAPPRVQLRALPADGAPVSQRIGAALADAGVPARTLAEQALPSWRGRTRVRLAQEHEGVPVIGATLVAQVGRDGGIALVQGRLASPTVRTSPDLAPDAAARIAQARVPGSRGADAPILQVLPDGAAGRLVWHTRVSTVDGPWRVLVDAHDGTVRVAAPLRAHALGRVYGNRAEPAQLTDVPLDWLPDAAVDLDGGVVRVRSRAWEGDTPAATADEAGDFLYEPDAASATDAFAEVNALWHATRTHAYFADVHGHPVPDAVDVLVNHTGSPGGAYDNAFFTYGDDGRYTLTFGQGADMDWSYDPGIVIHEFGHGIVDDQTGMLGVISYPLHMDEHGLHPAPGGLTEGLPDYWSTTRNDRSDSAELADGTPIRDSDNDARVPQSVLGEAHWDGVVIGGTTWEIREALGPAATDALVYGATGLVGSTPTYGDFAAALEVTGAALVEDGVLGSEDLDLIEDVLDQRGLRGAGRAIAVDPAAPPTLTWIGADVFDASFCEAMRVVDVPLTPPFQLAFTVPPAPEATEITGLSLRIEAHPLAGGTFADGDLFYDVVASRGELVRFHVAPVELLGSTWTLPREPVNADWQFPSEPDEVTLYADDLGEDVFTEGETIHVALPGTNCRSATLEVVPEWQTSPTPAPPVARATGGGGCRGKGAAAAFILPLGLLGLRRRMSALTE